jgi:aromatic ring-cleaving dioxygenase
MPHLKAKRIHYEPWEDRGPLSVEINPCNKNNIKNREEFRGLWIGRDYMLHSSPIIAT